MTFIGFPVNHEQEQRKQLQAQENAAHIQAKIDVLESKRKFETNTRKLAYLDAEISRLTSLRIQTCPSYPPYVYYEPPKKPGILEIFFSTVWDLISIAVIIITASALIGLSYIIISSFFGI